MNKDAFQNLKEDMSFIDGWEDKYRYIIELGQSLAPLEDIHKTSENKVNGCASQVWLTHKCEGEGKEAVLTFKGESDAHIVQGLLAIAISLFSGVTADKLAQGDSFSYFEALGLSEQISSQRSNGLKSLLAKMQHIATVEANR